jgi:hypothetical protein
MLVLSVGRLNGAFDDPESKSFKLRNPLLLKTWRPEKKVDSENFRVFSSLMGGFKAGVADLLAKTNGHSNRLSPENSLKDLLAIYGFVNDVSVKKIVLFLRRSLNDESIHAGTPLSYFLEAPAVEQETTCPTP